MRSVRWRSVALMLGTLSCALGASATPVAQTTPIKIGILDDVTGVTTIEGAEMRIGTDLVVHQINSSGGINGRPVQALLVDPKDNPTEAVQLAEQLTEQDGVDVLAGGVTVPECQALQNYAAKAHILYLPLDGCGGDQFTAETCDRYTFRVFNAGGQSLRTLTTSLVQMYGKRAGIVYADYATASLSTRNRAPSCRVSAPTT
jgi:ABC-type branched-subunit amino acid transport system substrate-binding protein